MRALSTTALYQYRKNSKRHSNLDSTIVKIRLNCLMNACDKEHICPTLNGTTYQFGNCKITVNGCNVIRSIVWLEEKIQPSGREIAKLHQQYKYNGLNDNGTKFLD